MGTMLAINGNVINSQEPLPIPVELMTKLWENPNPTSAFASQDIDLASDDYDFLAFEWRNYYTGSKYTFLTWVSKGSDCFLTYSNAQNGGILVARRYITRVSDTKYTVMDANREQGSETSATVDNNFDIPLVVYGFKKQVPLQSGNADYVSRTNGGTFEGDIVVDKASGTTTSEGFSILALGNDKSMTTDKNSTGLLDLYSDSGKRARIFASGDMADNRTVAIPDKSGTLAMLSDVNVLEDITSQCTVDTTKVTVNGDLKVLKQGHLVMVYLANFKLKASGNSQLNLITGLPKAASQFSCLCSGNTAAETASILASGDVFWIAAGYGSINAHIGSAYNTPHWFGLTYFCQ